MMPPADALEVSAAARQARKKKRTAPLPAPAVAASVPVPSGALVAKTALGQMVGLNRLRQIRMKTAGGNY